MAARVALLSLMRTVELEFLQPLPRPILQEMELLTPFNKHLVLSLHSKLGFLMELFDENRMDGVEAIKDLETKVRDVAFRVEDEIEFQIAHLHETEEEFGIGTPQGDTDSKKSSSPSFKLRLILQQGMEDIDAVKEEFVKIKNGYKLQATLDVLPISLANSTQPASKSPNKMIGRDKEFEIIKKMLIQHPSKKLEIVSIKGMGGIGKTTLAKQIYEDSSITSYFDKKAWVVASQHHSKRQMLLDLLCFKDDAGKSSDEDLSSRLYRSLRGRRYLVVMDDVWSVEAWDALKTCFPDDGNGSRVLLTTRFAEVTNHTSSSSKDDFSHEMQFLKQSESWQLFYENTYKSRGAEFEMIGRLIAEKCNGLPLTIIVVASLLSKVNTLDGWKNTANALSRFPSLTTLDDEDPLKILSLSYNHLPHNLKACFLYLGVFPKGKVIYVKDLVRLWACEGLIKEFEKQSLDEVAESYVEDLLDRSLILESKRSYCGRKIKAFKLDGLLHAFCVRQAQKENLLHVIAGNGFNFCVKGFRWLSIQSTDFDDDTSTLLHSASSITTCRSIFCFSEVKSLYLKSFNLLRVFYFSDASMCKKIVDLVHLRYLPQVVRDFRIIKLLKAWNLQTLDDGRNKLKKFGQQQDSQSRPSKLALKPCDCTIELFLRSPDLKEVVITGERSCCNECIDTLVFLPQLRGLYINGSVRDYRTPQRISINNQIGRLKGLVELSFQNMNFEWKGIDVLCLLRRLKVLRLLSSGMGKVWELPEDSAFCSLVYLEIFSTDLKHWKASTFNFWSLERLIFRNCFGLRKIPDSFTGIRTLKSIELTRCLPSAVNSVFQIKDEQRYYGRDDLDVIEKETIQPRSDGDESSEDDA